MLHRYLVQLFDLGEPTDFQSLLKLLPNDEPDPIRGLPAYAYADDPRVPLIASSHAEFTAELAMYPIVYILRNPYDVLVSNYFHNTRQWKHFSGPMSEYLHDERFGVPALVSYLNSWTAGLAGPDVRALITTYEQMTANTSGVLEDVVSFFGMPVNAGMVADAVEAGRFRRMWEIEVEQGIPGHEYDRSDSAALRVRSGRIAAYREHMDDVEVATAERLLLTGLSPETQAFLQRHQIPLSPT
jgi:hypothetical protein